MFKPVAEESSWKQTWKPLDRYGRETWSCRNEQRVVLGGLLNNLVLAKNLVLTEEPRTC